MLSLKVLYSQEQLYEIKQNEFSTSDNLKIAKTIHVTWTCHFLNVRLHSLYRHIFYLAI